MCDPPRYQPPYVNRFRRQPLATASDKGIDETLYYAGTARGSFDPCTVLQNSPWNLPEITCTGPRSAL